MIPSHRGCFALLALLSLLALHSLHPSPAVAAGTEEQPGAEETPPFLAGAQCEPVAELASLDHRQPVPLQPTMAWHQKQNMMGHLLAIQEITDSLAREDWDGVATAAHRIGQSPQMQQMCEHMGAGAPGFTEMALEFHRRADTIAEAATARDLGSVLRATAATLQSCTSCHSTFRQEIVDFATWQSRVHASQQGRAPGREGGP